MPAIPAVLAAIANAIEQAPEAYTTEGKYLKNYPVHSPSYVQDKRRRDAIRAEYNALCDIIGTSFFDAAALDLPRVYTAINATAGGRSFLSFLYNYFTYRMAKGNPATIPLGIYNAGIVLECAYLAGILNLDPIFDSRGPAANGSEPNALYTACYNDIEALRNKGITLDLDLTDYWNAAIATALGNLMRAIGPANWPLKYWHVRRPFVEWYFKEPFYTAANIPSTKE